VDELKRTVDEIKTLSGKQMSAFAHAHAHSSERSATREAVLDAMGRVSRCANGIRFDNPVMEDRFRMPGNTGDSKLLASARSFTEAAAVYKKDFIAFEMAPDFLEELSTRIAAVEKSFANRNASRTAQAGATQKIDNAMDRAMVVLEQLDPSVENKLEGDAVGIQNWRNVRHVERAWVSKKPGETKPQAAAA